MGELPLEDSAASYRWDVFLCHSSTDKTRVERLAEALIARGLRVWFDKASIKGSSSIPLKIEEGLDSSRTAVLCLSPAFLNSEWTAYERASILYADPANLRQSLLLLEFKPCELPRGLAHFRRLNFKRFSERRVDEIVEALQLESSPPTAEPSQVAKLLDTAKASERLGNYADAFAKAQEALAIAVEVESPTTEQSREFARARLACSHAFLLMEREPDQAWNLADLAADPEVLDGYPELMFSALVGKAEAAIAVGHIEAAQGAAAAAQELAEDDSDERVVLQIRGRLALAAGDTGEAVALYETAAQSFLAELNRSPDPDAKRQTKLGIGMCLSNKAIALRNRNDIPNATKTIARAADWLAQAQSPIDELTAQNYLARCHFDTQDWDSGFKALDRAQELAESVNFSPGLVASLELRARALATIDEPDLARQTLVQALAVIKNTDDDTSRRFHQMLATLAEDAADLNAAREHLERARLLALRSGDPVKIADVAHQLKRLGDRTHDRDPAPQELVDALRRELHDTESPRQATSVMQKLAGAYRSHRDFSSALEWFKRTYDTSTSIADHVLAASAQIGMADIAIIRNEDQLAEDLLEQALRLVGSLPAWEVKASANYFLGRLQARSGALHDARDTLRAASTTASEHHIDDLKLEIDDYLEDIEDTLGLNSVATVDLSSLSEEISKLEQWYPEARRKLRRFWWYQRGDEVLRNLRSHSGAKALLVSESAADIAHLQADLAPIFDLTTFASEEPFAASSDQIVELVPVPEDMRVPFMNVIGVVKEK